MSQITFDTNYFSTYTSLVNEVDICDAFTTQEETLQTFYEKITEEKACYAYAEGKWTLKEMLQHFIDTERIFCFRALAISRCEKVILPSFDENEYVTNSNANARTWASLVEEMQILRMSTQMMFNTFTTTMLNQIGKFGSAEASVNTIGLICIGHVYHHIKVVEERYF